MTANLNSLPSDFVLKIISPWHSTMQSATEYHKGRKSVDNAYLIALFDDDCRCALNILSKMYPTAKRLYWPTEKNAWAGIYRHDV